MGLWERPLPRSAGIAAMAAPTQSNSRKSDAGVLPIRANDLLAPPEHDPARDRQVRAEGNRRRPIAPLHPQPDRPPDRPHQPPTQDRRQSDRNSTRLNSSTQYTTSI